MKLRTYCGQKPDQLLHGYSTFVGRQLWQMRDAVYGSCGCSYCENVERLQQQRHVHDLAAYEMAKDLSYVRGVELTALDVLHIFARR